MAFWRKNKNTSGQERQDKEDEIIHPPGAPDIELPVEYDSDFSPEQQAALHPPTEAEIIEELRAIPVPHTMVTEPVPEPAESGGWLSRLTRGLSKSTHKLTDGIGGLITKKKLDQDMLDELEEVLITADLGPKTAAAIVAGFGEDRFGKDLSEEEIKGALADSIAKILEPVAHPLDFTKPADGPLTVLVCGVNGVGKTTTIGKIAYDLHVRHHRPVMMAAGDTFRAAAIEQLDIWSKRAHCKLVKKEIGADAAAVAFESYQQAKAENVDVLLIDTAGRLHNKSNLMAELQKVVRALKKHDPLLPHAVLLVLDATTGQNALEQVKVFKEMVNVTGLAVTKLDGSARGGIVVALADQFKLPIHLVGVGEKEEDLQPFHPVEYARSLVGL